MPNLNLPPGTGQSLGPAVTPTWVFSPASSSVTSTVRIQNIGISTVYVGGLNVSQFNGLPLAPGNRPLEMVNCPYTVYACSGVSPSATGYTLAASALAAGSVAFTTSASVASIVAGSVIIIGAKGSQEVVSVSATGGATTTTFTIGTATLYDHVASSPATLATTVIGQVQVIAGVV